MSDNWQKATVVRLSGHGRVSGLNSGQDTACIPLSGRKCLFNEYLLTLTNFGFLRFVCSHFGSQVTDDQDGQQCADGRWLKLLAGLRTRPQGSTQSRSSNCSCECISATGNRQLATFYIYTSRTKCVFAARPTRRSAHG